MENKEENLPAYLQTILEIQKNQPEGFSLGQKELKEMVLGVGITEEEWNEVQKIALDYQKRGFTFLEHQNWEDALKEFEKSYQINSNQAHTCYGLSMVYLGMWTSKKHRKSAFSAILYAQKCLNLHPSHSEAAAIISQVKRELPTTQKIILSYVNPIVSWGLLFGLVLAVVLYWTNIKKFFTDLTKKPAQEFVENNKGTTFILKDINFEVGLHQIKSDSKPELDRLVAFMKENKTIRGEISGHTDDTGDAQWNLDLSQRRASAVYYYLLDAGIGSARLEYKGYGSTKPIVPNDSDINRAKNRRIEFKIL